MPQRTQTKVLAWVFAVTGALAVAVVSLSDRAPIITESLLYRGRYGYRIFERRSGYDWLDRADIPFGWDIVAHFFLWGAVGFFGYVLARRRVNPLLIAIGLITASAAIEVAQVRFSATRLAEMSDLMANASGVLTGIGLAAIVCGLADVRSRLRQRSD